MGTKQRCWTTWILSFGLLAGVSTSHRSVQSAEPRKMSESLVDALRQGQADQVRKLTLAEPNLLESRGELGFTPLMFAALLGDEATLRVLLEAGADVHATNDQGGQALFYAANDLQKIRPLVEAGADVNHATKFGHTPIYTAVRSAYSLDEVHYLIEHGATVNIQSRFGVTLLSVAASTGNVDMVRMLIEHGADPLKNNRPTKVTFDDGTKIGLLVSEGSPLDKAIQSNHLEVARFLSRAGAKSEDPLGVAQFNHRPDMIRFAINELGAKPGGYSVVLASDNDLGNDEELRIVLEAGGDPHAAFHYPLSSIMGVEQTPLLQARRRGNTPIVRALLAAGAEETEDWWADKQPVPPKRDVCVTSLAPEDLIRSVLGAAPLLQRTITEGPAVFARHSADGKGCLSCHNQLLPFVALSTAKNNGLPLHLDAYAKTRETIESFQPKHEIATSSEVTFDPSPGHGGPLEIWGMLEANIKPSLYYDGQLHTIAQYQMFDGRWPTLEQRVPLLGTEIVPTAWAIRALAHYPMRGREAEFKIRVEKAKAFLQRSEPRSAEEAAHKILGLYWAGLTQDELEDQATILLQMQKTDGGWASSPYLEASDSYGTGQALYALSEAVGMGLEVHAYRRGLAFLVRTQLGDGSWFVRRRAIPFQPTMNPVFPHGRDGWLSATGTSWAVLALASSLSKSEVARVLAEGRPIQFDRKEPKVPSLPKAHPKPVTYTRDIQPILETSCIDCHGEESLSSGMYAMNTRDDLIRGNRQGPNVVVAGDSANSPLIKHVAGLIEDVEMPPLPHRDDYEPLTAEAIGKLRRWIDDGLPGFE